MKPKPDQAQKRKPKPPRNFWATKHGQFILAARREHADWSGLDGWR